MGRQLAGQVRIGKSKTWYARVTVVPKDRNRAGCSFQHLQPSLTVTAAAKASSPVVKQDGFVGIGADFSAFS